jgi:hypothetical protein
VGRSRLRGRAVQDDGRLPTRYRVASAGTAVFLTGALWLVLAAARVITTTAPSASLQGVGVWTLVGLFALNTVGNVAGRHPVERWGGVALLLFSPSCASGSHLHAESPPPIPDRPNSPNSIRRPLPSRVIGGMGETKTRPLVGRYADTRNLFDIPTGT